MGVDSKRSLPLPAPTETDTNNTPTELSSTELSKPGDERSHYSIPDDGTPVTIRTRGHKPNRSQTSLLIEYFEGSRSPSEETGSRSGRRPSVRVRLTPSRKGRGDHLQVTENTRKTSLTRRIPLDQGLEQRHLEYSEAAGEDANSMSSYASATEESNVSRNPIDIEIDHRPQRRRRPASPLIPSHDSYQPMDASEISAIPADSFLDGSGPNTDFKRSSSPSRVKELAAAAGAGALAGSALSSGKRRERVKTASSTDKPKEKSERKRRTKSRTSSMSEYPGDDRSSRHRSSRSHAPVESAVSGAEASVLSSNLTPSQRSMDTQSVRTGASRNSDSINNPKLLATVEDAIRRLILPELSALKREQSKRETRRDSLTSTGTSVSREDLTTTPDRRRSSGQRSESARDGKRRNREARHDYGDSSPRSVSLSRESMRDDYQADDAESTTPKRSDRGDLLKAAAAGAALSKGLSAYNDHSEDRSRKERRKRRAEGARSRSLGREKYAEEYDDYEPAPAPPMPLMSDINPSEMTRTSILSADSDRPQSASEQAYEVSQSAAPAPQRTLGTSHANVSHGDLTALPRGGTQEFEEEYMPDEFGGKIPMDRQDDYFDDRDRELSDPGDYPDRYEDDYYSTQDVPPPLKYVPYQAGARGLSPIPSVSGYTESEAPLPRNSQTLSETFESPEKSMGHSGYGGSNQSLGSVPSNMRSREFDQMSIDGPSSGLENRNTMYTEDSEVGPASSSGQALRGVGANPKFVHPPMGVESAVASLVDGSMLEQSVLTSGSGYDPAGIRNSQLSYDQRTQSSRGQSPEKRTVETQRDLVEDRHSTPGAGSQDQPHEYSEYELDDQGRKVPRSRYRQSPTASEAAITGGAVGAAVAALKAAQERKQATVEDGSEEWVGAGVGRNKSFKERTMEGYEPRNTPAHSIDRFSCDEPPRLGATGLPDMHDPMPEIGYVDDDALTNPSLDHEHHNGQHGHDYSGRATPTQRSMNGNGFQTPTRGSVASPGRGGIGLTEAAGAAALGAAAGMAAAHSREPSQDQDEWQRTSDERKRDTLLTNPYEDASPVANPALNDNILAARALDGSYNAPYHTGSPNYGQKYDEGYMSNGPNPRSPVVQPKGKALAFTDPSQVFGEEDPFRTTTPKANGGARQLSGMSQGMGSPFYDAATGAGIDRIENKDIVALMQHLMVRDAQRSARDTEIVALLMNAALEMRNSFKEMKDLIQDTGDDVIFSSAENTEKLQKAINGPRPFPSAGSRSIQSSQPPTTIDDAAAKKKNLWKRALAGLSAKGTNDLTRIEDMLNQLLGEVDVLKTQTAGPGSAGLPGHSLENLQPEGHYEQDRGYEPEGVSTASHASQSGQFSNPPLSRGPEGRHAGERDFAGNRVSTVPEHEDEYQYDHPSPINERTQPPMMTGAADYDDTRRGGSLPPDSPSQQASSSNQQHGFSADNTPKTEKAKKHKSSSSSGWIPKISRWSETTASSVGRAFRSSGNFTKKEQKYDDQLPPSRSGSSLASYDQYEHDPYGEDKLRTGFSDPNLGTTIEQADAQAQYQGALTSPEDPKYRAHRNSLNLQHPQPRPGQTERFRTALETSAQEFDDPATPRSADWAGSATSLNRLPQNAQRYSHGSSNAPREGEYWPTSPTAGQIGAPPRPPKEPLEGATGRTPPRARISRLAKGSPLQNQTYEDGYVSGPVSPGPGSPRPENRNLSAALGAPTRRPSGPRAMTPMSPEDEAARDERRRKRDTFGTVASQDTDTF